MSVPVTDLIRLRDLPGVWSIEQLCWNPRNFDYPKSVDAQHRIDEVSIALFGLTERDTRWDAHYKFVEDDIDDDEQDATDEDRARDEDIPTEEDWEEPYRFIGRPLNLVGQVWTVLGWDVTNSKGEELMCLDRFARQIVAVMRQLVPGAKLTLDGSGGQASDEQIEQRAEAWGDSLAQDARRFSGRSSRNR